METFRININQQDRSQTVNTDVGISGGMVLKARKGLTQPVYIPRGNQSKLIARAGLPSPDYPGVLEAIEFNKFYGLWISCPPGAEGGTPNAYGGVYFTTKGVFQFLTETDLSSLTKRISEDLGVIEDVGNLVISGIPSWFKENATQIVLDVVNEELVTVDIVNNAGTWEAQFGGTAVGTFVTVGNEDTLTINDLNTITLADTITTLDTLTLKATMSSNWDVDIAPYFLMAVHQKSATEVRTQIADIVYNYDKNTISFSVKEEIFPNKLETVGEWTVSPYQFEENGFGENIYVENVLDGSDYISGIGEAGVLGIRDEVDQLTAIEDIDVRGGYRNVVRSSDLGPDMVQGWQAFKANKYKDVKVFMDPEGIPVIAAEMASLRSTDLKYSRFVYGVDAADYDALITARGSVPMNNGMSYTVNRFKVQEPYTGTKFWTGLIGSVGIALATSIDLSYGALSPSFINENGIGGQLDRVVEEAKFEFDAPQLKGLDDAGLNPIILDVSYGLMIVGDKTGQTPDNISDTTFLGPAMLIDYLIPTIRDQILVPQLGKLNDAVHRSVAKTKAEAILRPVLQYLEESYVVCDRSNNTDAVLATRDFKLGVSIKITPNSQLATLDFFNVGQQSDVTSPFDA
jgi:hypothetical protein